MKVRTSVDIGVLSLILNTRIKYVEIPSEPLNGMETFLLVDVVSFASSHKKIYRTTLMRKVCNSMGCTPFACGASPVLLSCLFHVVKKGDPLHSRGSPFCVSTVTFYMVNGNLLPCKPSSPISPNDGFASGSHGRRRMDKT